jgi:drug/metabolite transporter (DMT)-like permease
MIGTGVLFGLLTTITWAIGIFPFTQAARRLGVNPLNHFRLTLATIFIALICLFISSQQFFHVFSSDYSQAWLWLGLSGVVGLTIGDYFAFEMYAILGARLGSVLTTFAPAAALLLGWMLLDDHMSVIGIIGIIITIIGVNYISLGKKERVKIDTSRHGKISWGIITGILAALCQGAGLVLAKKGMVLEQNSGITIQPFHATFIRLSIATLSLFLFTLLSGKIKSVIAPLMTNRENGLKYAVAGTIFGPTLGVSLSLYTVSLLEPSVAQTIFSLVPVAALLIARILTKEKITFHSLTGVVVAMVGVFILIWRDHIEKLF